MSDFNIQFEEQNQSITLEFEQIGGGAVKSVNGKTGAVVLDAGDLEYDDTETYSSGSVGGELNTLKDGLEQLETDLTNTINSVYATDTASGAIASFPDGADGVPVKSLTVDIEPVQSGSGDPSPTNVRPISGHSTATVTVSPTTDAQDGTSYTIDLNGTRYGGTLDATTGVLTVDRVCVEGDDLTWTYGDRWAGNVANYNPAPTGNNRSADLMCEKYKTTINASASVVGAFRYGGGIYVYSNDSSNHPTGKFVFHIEPTLPYQLTPNEISTVLGQNNIWADTGDVEVEYRADTKLYINKVLNA